MTLKEVKFSSVEEGDCTVQGIRIVRIDEEGDYIILYTEDGGWVGGHKDSTIFLLP